MARFLDPPKPKAQIPAEKVDKEYKAMRLKVFLGAFLGYAAYYLVRKNLSLAAPDMINDGILDAGKVGLAMSAVSIAYAFSKFVMGSVSDRSDARKFLCVGLILSALTMMAVGIIPFGPNTAVNTIIIFVLMLIVGWLSGFGWPPCGRIMAHWFSQNERSFKMSVWNVSHTIGSFSLGFLAIAGVSLAADLGGSLHADGLPGRIGQERLPFPDGPGHLRAPDGHGTAVHREGGLRLPDILHRIAVVQRRDVRRDGHLLVIGIDDQGAFAAGDGVGEVFPAAAGKQETGQGRK